jgi:hypothetical protein
MEKAAQVRAEMEEIDRLYREMDRAWRKIDNQENELWEISNARDALYELENNPTATT